MKSGATMHYRGSGGRPPGKHSLEPTGKEPRS
ncbi:hypothetical protein GGE06_001072 [Streptomyces sp. SFB5A]|jgi:hypothetical protein|uniref:Uncharacterized protein n=1 Tax=Streptomyces nymphaeiformis TaxID=2663842 RepID=A0A7W7TVM4_9ACTN|nr:hypothetical protein [Streptomyces nymphaeiformis]